MESNNVEIVRVAYEAYARGDLPTMLGFVDQDLEWTYLDPSLEQPEPQVCHGRAELENALKHWAEHGFLAELEEVAGTEDRVMVSVRTPGIGMHRRHAGDDRSYAVLTLRDGWIVALLDCRSREEALRSAGLG
jgi:ketosteroid isomerase-like protein